MLTLDKSTCSVGDVVKGIGLQNAGRCYTVLQFGTTRGRAYVEEHLTGRKFWTFLTYYRLV